MTITPIQQELHPVWGINDILLSELTPRLGNSFINLRATCRTLRDSYEPTFQKFRYPIFTERHGAIALCEKDLPLDTLINRVKNSSILDKQLDDATTEWDRDIASQPRTKNLYANTGLWVVIAPDGPPRLVNYKDLFFQRITSISELWKAQYKFYRREHDRARDLQLQKLFDSQNTIVSDLDEKPLNPTAPLQDLRDRYRRLQTLTKERATIESALKVSEESYNNFLKNLSLIERVVLFVISFFHSIFQKAYKTEFPALKMFNRLCNGVQLNEERTTITYGGNEIPVEISAKLYSNGVHSTTFYIKQKNGDQPTTLGSFEISREWIRIKPGTPGQFFSEDALCAEDEIGTLHCRRLYITDIKDNLGQDPNTGNKPLLRLITQLAVEIFQRESETRLVVICHHWDANIFTAGGFMLIPQLFSRKIAQMRGSVDVGLEKSSTDSGTQYVTNQEQPALVNFVPGAVPITWENQIDHHWILSKNTKGPILPKFFAVDFTRFEVFT